MKAQRLISVLFVILVSSIPATAQYAISTVRGTVRSTKGEPLPSARISWLQRGQMRWFETDSSGEFVSYFVDPGIHTFRFIHPSTSEVGTYVGMVPIASSLTLTIVLVEPDETGSLHHWRIREELPGPSDVWKPEKLLTSETIEAYPSVEHLWSFLNQLEPSVISDRFDISGLRSDTPFLIGVRGSSWSQNYGSLNGISVNDPSGNGLLVFPDIAAMEAIVYGVGESPSHHAAPGAHVELITKSGGRETHGEARLYFQSGALENSNITPRLRTFNISQEDERWKHFFNGGFQLSGPIGTRPWSYFAAFSGRELKKWIRAQSQPVSGNVQQQTYNFIRAASPNDRFGIDISLQRRNEPQFGASPQIRRDASVDRNQNYRNVQGSWKHDLSSRRSLNAKLGVAHSHSAERFQKEATGQSSQDLFPGFVVDGITPLDYMLLDYGRLINTTRGPAPSIMKSSVTSLEGNLNYATIQQGFRNSKHRISYGISLNRASRAESERSVDGVNLLFFQGEPNSVRLLNAPSTEDRVTDLRIYGADNFSISRFSFLAETSVNASRFSNILASGKIDNRNYWRNIGGRVGAAVQFIRRLTVRTAYAQIYDQPILMAAAAVNPEGLDARLFSWNDANGDHLFQLGENAQLLKVTGGPYTRLDGSLKNPKTTEFTVGVVQNGLKGFYTEFFGYRRTFHNQMSLVNEGVPFSSYSPIQVIDPGFDAIIGSEHDRPLTVYNQLPETLGRDRYLLTNPVGANSHSEGFEFSLGLNQRDIQANTTVTRYRVAADSGAGLTATQNDPSNLYGVFEDPNKTINSRGSTFFDRGTLVRTWIFLKLPAGLQAASIFNYQDGLPYARVLPVTLNQGVTGIFTSQRGPGDKGTSGGMRTTHYQTIDARFSKNLKLGKGSLRVSLDIFNLSNLALNLVQMEVTSHQAEWRVPLQFQAPRSFQPGLRYNW